MAVTYTTKEMYAFPSSLSGYTGFQTPEYPNVLSEFVFTLANEYTISKIFKTPFHHGFEDRPRAWQDIACPDVELCYARPIIDIYDPSGTNVQKSTADPQYNVNIHNRHYLYAIYPGETYGYAVEKLWARYAVVDGGQGFTGWQFYPNTYDDMNGDRAGYEPVLDSAPGHLAGTTGKYCMRVLGYDTIQTPAGYPVNGYGGAWFDLFAAGVTAQLNSNATYRFSWWSKAEQNTGVCIMDARVVDANHNESTEMTSFFTPGNGVSDDWTYHERIFKMGSNPPTRLIVMPRLDADGGKTNCEFLIDAIKLEEIEATITPPADKVLWDFGDGTFQSGTTARHVYKYPGEYEVKCVLYDAHGNQLINTEKTTVKVSNFLRERLELDTTVEDFTTELPAGEAGFNPEIPQFKINRYNTWQSWPELSGSNYSLNLYASGSLSKSLNVDRFFNEKWSHLDQTWSFYEKITATNGAIDWMPVNDISTTNTELYFRWREHSSGELYIAQCNKSDAGACFVGTSGSGEFRYIDDTPKNMSRDFLNINEKEEEPVLLFASLDFSKFPARRTNDLDDKIANLTNINLVEGQKLIMPVTVVPTAFGGLSITSTGQSQMPLSKFKWTGAPSSFFINTVDINGYITESAPPLTACFGAETPLPGIINATLKSTADDLPIDGAFYRDTSTNLPRNIKSRQFGFFVPAASAVNSGLSGAVLSASYTSLKSISGHGEAEVQRKANTLRSFIVRNTGEGSELLRTIDLDATANGVNDVLGLGLKITDVPTDLYGVATHFSSQSGVNAYQDMWFADAGRGLLHKFDHNLVPKLTIDHKNIVPSTTYSPVTSQFLNRPHSLAGVAIDSKKNVWVTDDVNSNITKYNGISGTWLNTISAPQLSSFVQPSSAIPDLVDLAPLPIDTDVDDDIWVGFTHPESCMVGKFDGTTGEALTGYQLTLQRNETPSHIVVDDKSNCFVLTNFWAATGGWNTAMVNAASAYRGADESNYSYLTGMDLGTTGFEGNFAYMLDGAWLALSAVKDYGAFHVSGFDNSNICEDAFNGWGWKGSEFTATTAREIMFLGVHPVRRYPAGCAANYSVNNLTTSTNMTITYHPGGRLYKIDRDGSLSWTISGLYCPMSLTVDNNQNIWVADRVNTLLGYHNRTGELIEEKILHDDVNVLDRYNATVSSGVSAFPPGVDQFITGMAGTEYGRIVVIDGNANHLVYIPIQTNGSCGTPYLQSCINNPATNTSIPGQVLSAIPGSFQAYGDFTGFNWVNKYTFKYPEYRRHTFGTTFNIYPSGGIYNVNKFNEDYDAAETLKSYRQQEFLLNSDSFFDDVLGEAVGTLSGKPTEIGKTIYEKIANFVPNTSDIETCNLNALYSLAKQHNVPIANFNYPYPGNLRRILDLGSIKHSKLWGARNKHAKNFELNYSIGSDIPLNLGAQIPLSVATSTFMLSAGSPVVVRSTFNNEFRLIEPMVIDNSGTFGSDLYDSSAYPLTSYPLSAYSDTWGWGIDPDVDVTVSGTTISNYYDFYYYIGGFDNTQLEGVLDWSNISTLNESESSLSAWHGDYGILENMIENELRVGTYNYEDSHVNATPLSVENISSEELVPIKASYDVSYNDATNKYTIDGVDAPQLWVKRGSVVEFNTDSKTDADPFRIYSDPNNTVYASGVTYTNNAAGTGGKLSWTPPTNAPAMLFYGSLSSRNLGYGIGLIT